jgi:hypothetical protein
MEDYIMTTRLLFVITEEYSVYTYGSKVWDLLDIKPQVWSKYKKECKLPLKHYKTICDKFGLRFTDEDSEICEGIVRQYYSEVRTIEISGYRPQFTTSILGGE